MHIVLTDVLACPRCGPQFGLILLADRVDDRRVLEGVLGCPNCREKYAVRAGLGLLRVEFDDIEPVAIPAPAGDGGQEAVRIAALAGITEGPALLLLMGPLARYAPMLAGLLENVEVVWGRAEEQPTDVFAVALAKALAKPPVAAELCLPLVREGGIAVLWVGETADPERVARAAARLAATLEVDRDGLLVLRKHGVTPPGFPRRPGIAKKRPLA